VGGIFDGQLALRQLRYAGLFEAIRIRKSGYAYRATFRVFANSYQILVDGMTKKRESNSLGDQDCCRAILAQVTAGGCPHMTALHTLSDFVVLLLRCSTAPCIIAVVLTWCLRVLACLY
jgi:hypothetical protein